MPQEKEDGLEMIAWNHVPVCADVNLLGQNENTPRSNTKILELVSKEIHLDVSRDPTQNWMYEHDMQPELVTRRVCSLMYNLRMLKSVGTTLLKRNEVYD
jgi:hypothetical protein